MVWGGMLVYSTGPVILAASSIDGGSFSLLRLGLGVAVIGILALIWHRKPPPLQNRHAGVRPLTWTILGGVAFGIHQFTLALAVKATSVADVAVLNAVSPLVVVALALPLLGERPTRRLILWAPVAMLGSGVVAFLGATGVGANPTGTFLALVNIVFFSVFMLCSKLATSQMAVWPFLWGVMVTATLVVGMVHIVTRRPVMIPDSTTVLLALTMALGPGALGHFLMTTPLRWVPVSLPPVVRLLQPFASGGLAWFLLHQPFTWLHAGGAAITAVGVLGAMGPDRPPRPKRSPL